MPRCCHLLLLLLTWLHCWRLGCIDCRIILLGDYVTLFS
jgi:hypothetical protein